MPTGPPHPLTTLYTCLSCWLVLCPLLFPWQQWAGTEVSSSLKEGHVDKDIRQLIKAFPPPPLWLHCTCMWLHYTSTSNEVIAIKVCLIQIA